jgi:hypothetical protein
MLFVGNALPADGRSCQWHRGKPRLASRGGRTNWTGARYTGACQRQRQHETGLSLLAILGTPDFEAKFRRRMEEVVKPCMAERPF